ncbi:MAG: nucleotidyltransferase family protein [Promethearchaeia archaeon]
MTNLSKVIEILENELPKLKKKYHIKYLGVFGSFVRKEQNENSDLDILISFRRTPTLFQFIQLENYLSQILDLKVDLVMKDTLKPAIGSHILNEVIKI